MLFPDMRSFFSQIFKWFESSKQKFTVCWFKTSCYQFPLILNAARPITLKCRETMRFSIHTKWFLIIIKTQPCIWLSYLHPLKCGFRTCCLKKLTLRLESPSSRLQMFTLTKKTALHSLLRTQTHISSPKIGGKAKWHEILIPGYNRKGHGLWLSIWPSSSPVSFSYCAILLYAFGLSTW